MPATVAGARTGRLPCSPVAVDVRSATQLLHETLIRVSREAPRGVRSERTKQLEKDIQKSQRSCELLLKLLFAAQDANVEMRSLESVPGIIVSLLRIRGTPPGELSWEELHERELHAQCGVDPLQWRHGHGSLSSAEKAMLRDRAREQAACLTAIADGLDRDLVAVAARPPLRVAR